MLDRIVGDPYRKLNSEQLSQLADLRKHEGFKILEEITEQYVRGYVVDNLLADQGSNPDSTITRAQGIAQGARWVIDRVLVSYKSKKKKIDERSK